MQVLQAIKTVQRKIALDNFVLSIIAVAMLALVFPVSAAHAPQVKTAVTILVGMLFFLYGVRIHPRDAFEALKHWRLHSLIFGFTFILFPLIGVAARWLPATILDPSLYPGFLFLTFVPSTVQSSVSFTSIARGNVPAAIISASFSNIAGIIITPLLVLLATASHILTISGNVTVDASSVIQVVEQLLVPFLLGQAVRPLVRKWVEKHHTLVKYFDRCSILLVVYSAFSEGQREHAWSTITPYTLLCLIILSCALVIFMLLITKRISLRLGFSIADAKTVQFCGTKKSLATGVPMAMVIFQHSPIGIIVLPLMVFHQIQLMLCSWLAGYYSRQLESN